VLKVGKQVSERGLRGVCTCVGVRNIPETSRRSLWSIAGAWSWNQHWRFDVAKIFRMRIKAGRSTHTSGYIHRDGNILPFPCLQRRRRRTGSSNRFVHVPVSNLFVLPCALQTCRRDCLRQHEVRPAQIRRNNSNGHKECVTTTESTCSANRSDESQRSQLFSPRQYPHTHLKLILPSHLPVVLSPLLIGHGTDYDL
jgi:hypothetical protein